MDNSEKHNPVTVGNFLDFMIGQQSKAVRDTLSTSAIKAYDKKLLHFIPSLLEKKTKSPMPPVYFAEENEPNKFLESSMLKKAPQDLLDREVFSHKWFEKEEFFSWCHLDANERPPLPRFCVTSRIGQTVFKIYEFDSPSAATRFSDKTAQGIKDGLASAATSQPRNSHFLSLLSEVQVVKGTRVLVLKHPELATNRFGYNLWWHYDHFIFTVEGSVIGPQIDRDRTQSILRGSVEKTVEYQDARVFLDVYLKNIHHLGATSKETKNISKETNMTDLFIAANIVNLLAWSLAQKARNRALSAMEGKAMLMFPKEVKGIEASFFNSYQLDFPLKHSALRIFARGPPPKELYQKAWRENFENVYSKYILANDSQLMKARDKTEILMDAFTSGPPRGFINVHYGSELAVSLLFFESDMKGPLGGKEAVQAYLHDEGKSAFIKKLMQKYIIMKATQGSYPNATEVPPFITLEKDNTQPKGSIKDFWGVFKMSVFTDKCKSEYVWIWQDELGVYFLNAVHGVDLLSCEKCGQSYSEWPRNGKCSNCGKMICQILGDMFSEALQSEQNTAEKFAAGNKEKSKHLLLKTSFFECLRAKHAYESGNFTEEEYRKIIAKKEELEKNLERS